MDGFESMEIDTGETRIFVRRGGSGPPLLLLHGFPQTHLMWRDVAPRAGARLHRGLRRPARLRPKRLPGLAPPTTRRMRSGRWRGDMVRGHGALGFARFSVAGPRSRRRASPTAWRSTIPTRVERLAVLDIVPTDDGVGARRRAARAGLLALVAAGPARAAAGAPAGGRARGRRRRRARRLGLAGRPCFRAEVRAAYVEALRDPAHVHAICEEYRAAATHRSRARPRPIAQPAAASPARCWRCGARAARSTPGMPARAGRSRCGARGPTTCRAAPSTPATSSRRKRPARQPRHCGASSSCSPENGARVSARAGIGVTACEGLRSLVSS